MHSVAESREASLCGCEFVPAPSRCDRVGRSEMGFSTRFLLGRAKPRWMVRNFYFHKFVIAASAPAVFCYGARAEKNTPRDGTIPRNRKQRIRQIRLNATVKIIYHEFSERCGRLPFYCQIRATSLSTPRRFCGACQGKKILKFQDVQHAASVSHFRQSENESKQSLPKRHTIFAANTLCPRSVGVRGLGARPPRSLEGICE